MYEIETDYQFCYDSEDYKQPAGSEHDYHTNPLFIQRASLLFRRPIKVLDLGCANGSMIVDFINRGHSAIGIDGSDYGVKHKTGGWGTNPNNFFNADVAKPFKINEIHKLNSSNYISKAKFDIITSWEMFEHIRESDLPQLITNIKNHIHSTSLCFFSIALFHSGSYHQNVKNEAWWRDYLGKEFIIYDELMGWWTLNEWVRRDEGPDKRFHVIVGPK